MPAAYTPQQRQAIQQYVHFAKVKDSAAAKALKAANWDVNVALNDYLNSSPKPKTANLGPSINAVFDQYRDDPTNSPDNIGVEGSMGYLSAIDVTLEEPASVAIHHLVGAEAMGELERSGFVSGWESQEAGTVDAMRAAAAEIRQRLTNDRDYFRAVYRHAFLLGRVPGQKSAQLDTAVELWRLMLGGGSGGSGHADGAAGLVWRSPTMDWLSLWLAFIEDGGSGSSSSTTNRAPRVVSRDLWNQTEVFARKSLDDPALTFWSEEASWPTVIDDFVRHIKETQGVSSESGSKSTAMDVE